MMKHSLGSLLWILILGTHAFGLFHSFTKHRDFIWALTIPPVAWYHGIEGLFWHDALPDESPHDTEDSVSCDTFFPEGQFSIVFPAGWSVTHFSEQGSVQSSPDGFACFFINYIQYESSYSLVERLTVDSLRWDSIFANNPDLKRVYDSLNRDNPIHSDTQFVVFQQRQARRISSVEKPILSEYADLDSLYTVNVQFVVKDYGYDITYIIPFDEETATMLMIMQRIAESFQFAQ